MHECTLPEIEEKYGMFLSDCHVQIEEELVKILTLLLCEDLIDDRLKIRRVARTISHFCCYFRQK